MTTISIDENQEKQLLRDWFSRVHFTTARRRRVAKAGGDSPQDPDLEWEYKHGWIPVTSVDRITRLKSSVSSGISDEKRLTGGVSAQTSLVEFKNGSKAVRKVSVPPEIRNEYLAAEVADAIGVRAPAVYQEDEYTVYMDYVDGETAGSYFSPNLTEDDFEAVGRELNRAMKAGEVHPDDRFWYSKSLQQERLAEIKEGRLSLDELVQSEEGGRRIGLLDALILNIDRNYGNWMVTPDNKPVAIDHGHSEAFGGYYTHYEGENGYKDRADKTYRSFTPFDFAHLSPEEVRQFKENLEAKREIFTQHGESQALDFMLRYLDDTYGGG